MPAHVRLGCTHLGQSTGLETLGESSADTRSAFALIQIPVDRQFGWLNGRDHLHCVLQSVARLGCKTDSRLYLAVRQHFAECGHSTIKAGSATSC